MHIEFEVAVGHLRAMGRVWSSGLEFMYRARVWRSGTNPHRIKTMRVNDVTHRSEGDERKRGTTWEGSASEWAPGALKLSSRSLEKKCKCQVHFLCEDASGKSERTWRKDAFRGALQRQNDWEDKGEGRGSTSLTVQL